MNNTLVAPDLDNITFRKAALFVCDTDEHIFLTGKAGSGKTTFLKYIRTKTTKKCAVVAPTGIAAINAGGETIHSFLQLPFTPFIPGSAGGFGSQPGDVEDKHSLLARLRLRDTKLQLLRKLQLLIIDEVSMLRADLLDAMDTVLRHVRKRYHESFGGVQMLFIGDMFQLPPVVPPDEWDILRKYYDSAYFFDAHVLRENPPLYIELTKVYRQKDQDFIALLNRIRTGDTQPEDIELLNRRYDTSTADKQGHIILCTHNNIADTVNQQHLDALPAKLHTFTGTITNEFNARNLPAELELQLKQGAQVMFIKNDLQTPRRYYNGKIAIVDSITPDGIFVTFPSEPQTAPLMVEQEVWKNVRYSLDSRSGNIVEDEMGSFTQFPLRLAWAITVHKSQGLTLEHAIVDLNRSFASGQVYVALSRCTSIEGLTLRSKLSADNVFVDDRIIAFAETEANNDELDERLFRSMRLAKLAELLRTFTFTEEIEATERHIMELGKRKTGPTEQNQLIAADILAQLQHAQKHAQSFHRQLQNLHHAGDDAQIKDRETKARTYFVEQVLAPIIATVTAHLASFGTQTKVAKQVRAWKNFKALLEEKKRQIEG